MDGDGLVVNELKRPFSNGTTHVLFEPLDFMARLAALVPRPRVHLVRYHGLFAPNAKHRHRIVKHTPGTTGSDDNLECSHDSQPTPSSASMSWMQRLRRVLHIDISQCPRCGGRVRVIGAITEPTLIRQLLEHIGARAPPAPSVH